MKAKDLLTYRNIFIAGGLALTTAIVLKSIKRNKFKQLAVKMIEEGKVSKSDKADSVVTSDALNPIFATTIKNPVSNYPQNQIDLVAKRIANLDGFFNTDEKAIIKEIKTNVKSKYFMSLVSAKFEDIKEYGLSSVIDKWFSKSEKAELHDYLTSLPVE